MTTITLEPNRLSVVGHAGNGITITLYVPPLPQKVSDFSGTPIN